MPTPIIYCQDGKNFFAPVEKDPNAWSEGTGNRVKASYDEAGRMHLRCATPAEINEPWIVPQGMPIQAHHYEDACGSCILFLDPSLSALEVARAIAKAMLIHPFPIQQAA